MSKNLPQRPLQRMKYEVLIDAQMHQSCATWCFQTFGKRWNVVNSRDGTWTMYWAGKHNMDKYRVCFDTEQDMMWFKLKWS